MKKLIVAAAGLMLVGTMVSNASAEAGVSFKGDARARGLYRSDYNFVDSDTSQWQSRVRLIFQGESKGGAYANARVRFADSAWDGTQKTRALGEGSNIYTDWAYVGTPMGPLAVEAGLMPWNITRWAMWDQRVDGLNVKYVNDMTTVMAFYQKMDEFDETDILTVPVVKADGTAGTLIVNNDIVEDDDRDRYGVYLNQKFDGGWGVVGAVLYQNDDQGAGDRDGVTVIGEVTGTIGNVAVQADGAWQEADVLLTPDDPWGVYAQAVVPVGDVSLLAGAGATVDGFVVDGDYQAFIMLSDDSSIATAYGVGAFGDTNFVVLSPSMKVSEQLTLTGVAGYLDIDSDADSAFEISGRASYAVTDGATLSAEAGYLDVDGFEEPAIGAGLILVIGF